MAYFIRKELSALLIVSVISFSTGCGTDATEPEDTNEDTTSVKNTDEGKSASQVFYSMPSPIELASLIQKAGAKYDKNLLNNIDNVSKYTTSTSMAANLGVYGADLSLTTIFDQTQESIFYLKCARRLADNLGITGAFSDETVDRMQNNYGNQDSLLTIITDSYFTTDEYLKENQRPNVSALVIAGGWIEGLYIGTQLAKNTKNNAEIIQRIAELKGSLNNLVALMNLYKGQDGIDPLLKDLEELKKIYDEIGNEGEGSTVSTDEKSKVTTIGGSAKLNLTKEQLEKVTALAEKMRTQIVNP